MLDQIQVNYITSQIRQQNCTPVISNQLVLDMLFGKYNMAPAWADDIGYPMEDRTNLTRMAQFLYVQQGDLAKWSYLDFLKRYLLRLEQEKANVNRTFLETVAKQVDRLTFTQLAHDQLHALNFAAQEGQTGDNPLSILARLDIPVYITTSHHSFLEEALKALGKQPKAEAYCWREDLNVPEEYAVDLKFAAQVGAPVVYHLYGIDSHNTSLVLTEDDHLDFLVSIARDFDNTQIVPNHVRDAISKSVLLLLGYEVHGWDLKTFLKGLIENRTKHPDSVAIQIDPTNSGQIRDMQRFSDYIRGYFKRVRFDVIWAKPEDFITALWNKLQ